MSKTSNVQKPAAAAGAAPCSAELPRCTACKWMTRDCDDNSMLCGRPGIERPNIATGGRILPYCLDEREPDDFPPIVLLRWIFRITKCGEKAKYFQPNDPSSAAPAPKGGRDGAEGKPI